MAPEKRQSDLSLSEKVQRALRTLEERRVRRNRTVLGISGLVLALAVAAIEGEPSTGPGQENVPAPTEHIPKPRISPSPPHSDRVSLVGRRLKSIARHAQGDKPFDESAYRVETMIEALEASMDLEAFSAQCKQALDSQFQPNGISLPSHLAKFEASYREVNHYVGEIQKEEKGGDMHLSTNELLSVRNQLCGSVDFDAELSKAMQGQLQEMLVSSDLSMAEKYLIFKDYMPFLGYTLLRDADTGLMPIDPQIFQVAGLPFELKSYGISLDTDQVDKDLLLGFGQSARNLIAEMDQLQPGDGAIYQKYEAVESLVSLISTGMYHLPDQENQEFLDDFLGFSLGAIRDKYLGRK